MLVRTVTVSRFFLFALLTLVLVTNVHAGYTSSNDPHGFPPGCNCNRQAGGSSGGVCGAGGGTGGGAGGGTTVGMPTWSVSSMLISLSLHDTPLTYAPPIGQTMDFKLSYNQLDIDQPSTFSYANVGPKWTYNWLGYVQDDPATPGQRTLVYLSGGPGRPYGGYDAGSGRFAPDAETGAYLVRVSSAPLVYERRYPDGSKDVFAASDGSTHFPRRIFLTQRIDAQGHAVNLEYDDQHRLTRVTDALGHALSFHYVDSVHPLAVTGVSDSFGRTIALAYDAQGRLASVTDAIGMTSTFGYDGGTSITSLTTPYGTTTFASHESGVRRWIDITDPDGSTSRWEFNEAVSGVPFSESHVPQGIDAFNRYINSRDSFYWDASAFKQFAGDYSKAVIYHWTHKTSGRRLSSVTADALESVKYPLESRIWYNHPNDIAGGSGSLNLPTRIARVLPDGSTQLTRNTYSATGKLLQSIDPTGLETDYTYSPNGIDVVKIERHGANDYHAVETFSYNDHHQVLTHTDETGATTTTTYNDAGEVLTQTDALDGVTRYTYDDAGYRLSMTDANGHTTHYAYDALGRLVSQTDPLNRTTRYAYDALNRLVRTTYPDGSYTATTWDKLDKAAVRDRNGHVATFTYDAMRHRTSATDALGHTTHWTYYPNGLMHTRTDANGHTTTWQRDLEGRVVAIADANGATTTYVYDSAGRRTRVTNALGQPTNYAFDHMDRPIRMIDANGIITSMTYTVRGWLATHIVHTRPDATPSADDAATIFRYNARGDRTVITDPDGVITNYTWDADRRLSAVTDALSNAQIYTRDAVGNLTAEADAAAGHNDLAWLHSYAYDAADQRIQSIDADNHVISFRYDANGRLRDTRDPLGVHALSVFDAEGRLLHSVRGLHHGWDDYHAGLDHHQHGHDSDHDRDDHHSTPASIHYTYDAANRLIAVTDPGGLTTRYVYDAAGQKIEQTSPDTGDIHYAYDAVDNRVRQIDARGVESDRDYDALHRLTAIHYPSDSAQNVHYSYDQSNAVTGCAHSFPIGRLTGMTDPSGSTTWCYDSRGNVIAEHKIIAGTPYAIERVWTPADRLATLTYPGGTRVVYSHDAAGRVIGITKQASADAAPVSVVSAIDYLPFGPITKVVYGKNDSVLQNSYDSNYRGTAIAGLGLSISVRRDANGNIVVLREGYGHGPLSERYRYDALQRLTDATGPWGWFGQHYTYNATGDRTAKHAFGHAPVRYRYQPGTHRLAAIDSVGGGNRWSWPWLGGFGQWHHCDRHDRYYSHHCRRPATTVLTDASGNIIHMPQDSGILSLTYGANNRLVAVSHGGVGHDASARYRYDGHGLRVEKITTAPHPEIRDFIYASPRLLGEYVPASGSERDYIWLGDTLIASLDIGASHVATIHYIGTDFLGTPRSVTDTQRNQVWRWNYTGNAFGDQPAVGMFSLNLRFPGQYHDVESGINYNIHRDYNPSTGRYVESDPLGLKGGITTYGYSGANPLNASDPLGLWVKLCIRWLKGLGITPHYTNRLNPFTHYYLDISGDTIGFGPGGSAFWGPGQYEFGEHPELDNCSDVCDDPQFDKYVRQAIAEIGLPNYSIAAAGVAGLFGAENCQTWAIKVLGRAKMLYRRNAHCPKCKNL